MIKKLLTFAVALPLSAFVLAGCNTMEGAGKDVQAVGTKIENAADRKK